MAAVTQNHADHAAALGGLTTLDLHDFSLHRLQGSGRHLIDGTNIAEVVVGAREMKEHVSDGLDAELAQQLHPRRADAFEKLGALLQRLGRRCSKYGHVQLRRLF